AAGVVRVIVEPRRGYGRACLTGVAVARNPDTVVFLDGDYSGRPGELGRLLDPIREGRADVVLGSRLAGGLVPGAMPWHAVFGNRLAARLIRWLYGISLTDLGPFRAARCDVLRAVDLREMTYGWAVELVTRGAMHGYRVMEVPVSYHPRIGASKISGTLKGSIGAAWCILAVDSDSPHLPLAILQSAFELLETNEVVVGPTEDGGYYLVGASAMHPRLFDSAPLGTGNARDALLGNARALGLSVAFTEPWYD